MFPYMDPQIRINVTETDGKICIDRFKHHFNTFTIDHRPGIYFYIFIRDTLINGTFLFWLDQDVSIYGV